VIAKISGTLSHKSPGEVVVDVGGVGYHVHIPLTVFYRLPDSGGRVSLHVHTHLREDSLQLYGFLEQDEKRVFLLLTGVSGIGPRLAVNILSGIPAEALTRALRGGDLARLLAVPGVGRKLAERLIVELKDKLGSFSTPEAGRTDGPDVVRDAVSALVNLGYRESEAEKTVRAVADGTADGRLTDVLKEALRRLSHS
jgi:Holliday junction DNA helicase RuvA